MFSVAELIREIQLQLNFKRSAQTWATWRKVVELQNVQTCNRKQAMYLIALCVWRLEDRDLSINSLTLKDVRGYLLKNHQKIANYFRPIEAEELTAFRIPAKRETVTWSELPAELAKYGRVVEKRTLYNWVKELDEKGVLTIDIRRTQEGKRDYKSRKFTPRDVDLILKLSKEKELARQERGRILGNLRTRKYAVA